VATNARLWLSGPGVRDQMPFMPKCRSVHSKITPYYVWMSSGVLKTMARNPSKYLVRSSGVEK
jgi:hypothetical protein